GRNLKYLFANEKLLLRLGKSLNELVGQDYFQFHSPDGTKEFSAMVEKVFKSGKPVNYEHKSHRDGRDFIRTLSPINDPKTKTITAVTIISKDITERKRAAEALWESEEWNKIILNTVMAGVIVVDAETRQIIKINERVVNLIGLPKELIIGNVCHKFICPAEEKNCPVLDLGNIVDCSERVLLKSNQEKADIIKTVVPLTLHNHKYLVESFVDITERKQADEALRENEERYRAVVENSHSGILIVGEDYKFNYINDALCNIFGRRREDIIGHDFKEFLDNDSKSLVADRYLRRQRGEEVPPRYEFNVVRKDGEKRRVEISSTVVRDSQGRARTIAQLLDITERKRSEEQVHYQANLLQNVSDAIIASDKDGIIQIWNPAAEKIYGWKSDEVRGKKFHEIIKPEYHYKSREGVFEKIKADGVWSGEIVHHRKDGQPISILSTISGLKDNSGNQTGLVSVNHDITERKQAEEALKESEAKYRLMVESSRDAIVISQNDRYIFINDAFANMLGYQKADLLMSSYKKVYTEEAIKILEERDKQGSTGEAVADRYETVFKKKDGAEVHVEANVRIIDYKGQKATFAVIRNITKQKEILAALQASIEQSQGLKNFISICAGCNKIRDDEQENRPWVSPADYIVDRLPGIKFSHGMCPDCMKKWYPDYVDKKIVK
ncbi:PAS domain-containing protein, partial [bacterium]|nr:PAS domain-containing protein [bacterium]